MKKLLKRLAATPMRRSEYLLSQILARFVFLVFEIVIVVGFGTLVFGVEVRGSFGALAVVSLAGAAAFAGLGLLVSSRTRTMEGVNGLMNLVMLPMWLLSGTFFSWERFPEAVHPYIRALPLTALNDALRAVMTEGRPLSTLGLELGVLFVTGTVSFLVAVRVFRWQ
jgi:ABC-type multidrug transport system permease subunit